MKKLFFSIILIAGIVALSSCNDKWDEHYDSNSQLPSATLMELIDGYSDLSLFSQMVHLSGADSLLNSNQTYTVWAPVNDALKDVDVSDKELCTRIVRNHMARYTYPSSTNTEQAIVLLNGKSKFYTSNSVFGSTQIRQADNRALNGILHVMSGQIPYQYNFLEFLSTHEDYSELYNFISSFDESVYDAEQSTVYDSVFVTYNRLLENINYGIGSIGDEDSVYTMILPDNAAWKKAFDYISPYYTVFSRDEAYADSVQRVQTSLAIVNGLTFRGRITDAASLDSIKTVGGSVIKETDRYLGSYSQQDASNGLMYLANGNLVLDDTCVWNPTIVVEAEDVDSRTTVSGSNAFIRNTDANSPIQGVSGNSYLEVSSSSLDGGVTFNIVGVLAGKYDIYCDFLAPEIDGEKLATEQTRVQFQLRFQSATGSTKTINVNSKSDEVLLVGGEDAHGIISVLAYEGQEFPTSNYYDSMWFADPSNTISSIKANTTLQVKTNVSTSELGKTLVRRFRLDKIRFVPVQ